MSKENLIAMLGIVFISLSIQSGMKYREHFRIDKAVQSGILIYDTGRSWILTVRSDGKFPAGIASISDTGEVLWERSFAFPPVTVVPDVGGVMMLDQNGNFYRIDRAGAVTSNMAQLVQPGRNVMTKSEIGLIYASGSDNSITCFKPDGNIEWMAVEQSDIISLFASGEGVIASEKSGALVKFNAEGESEWKLEVEGFAPDKPEIISNGNLVYGIRSSMGSQGKVLEVTMGGEIIWETKLGHGGDKVFTAGDGYLVIGSLYVTALQSDGVRLWGQSFEGSKKLYPMGFSEDGRMVLGILNRGDEEDSLKITLLDWAGSISVVCKIPVTKNRLISVSRRGNLVLIADNKETVVYRLMTMKEFIEGSD